MGLLGSILGGLFSGKSSDDLGCDWYCDGCDALMNSQPGFTTSSEIWTCTECGYVNDVTEDNIRYDDDEKENTYSAIDEINDIPEGCRACGGQYPNCTYSCPLFDD